MARDSSGTYTRVSGAAPTANSVSSSTKFNSELDDIKTELTDSVSRSNKGALLADLNAGAFSLIFTERTAPSSPAADKLAVYAKDNGSGTTKLYAKDSGGTETDLFAGGAALDITGLTAETAPATDDVVPLYDTSAAANRKMTFANFLKVLNSLTEDTAPDISADFVLTYDTSASAVKKVKPNKIVIGKQTIGIDAGGLFQATTNGCAALAQAETSTNKINYKYLAFDATSVEYAWKWIPTPKSYNASTLTARVVWTHPVTTTNFGVVWQIEILSLSNDDAIDQAVGTAITVTDTGGTTQDFYTSDAFAAITPSNTAAKQDWLAVRVSRLASNGSDTMAVDAHLIGVELYYTTDNSTDD